MRNLVRLREITYTFAIGCILYIQPLYAEDEGLDLDGPPDTENVLTDTLRYGLEVQFTFERESNFDLDNRSEDDIAVGEPQLSLAVAYTPLAWLQGFVELELISPIAIDSHEIKPDTSTTLKLKQTYFAISSPDSFLSLKVGRQYFTDPRQWLYDENLDAARLRFGDQYSSIEASASYDRLNRRDLLNNDDDAKTNRYLVFGHHGFNSGITLNAYVLVQDEHRRDAEDP